MEENRLSKDILNKLDYINLMHLRKQYGVGCERDYSSKL